MLAGASVPRKPSCLISCSQVSPLGGCGALVGRQGGTKPHGKGIAAYRAWARRASTKGQPGMANRYRGLLRQRSVAATGDPRARLALSANRDPPLVTAI
jgi:hypothetical protein